MKHCLFGVAVIFAMSLNTAIFGALTTCHVSATRNKIMEIREIFSTIRSSIHKQDNYIDLRILQTSLMQSIPPSDQCCFLELVIHFYMEKVFRHYSLLGTEQRTTIRKIANFFFELLGAPISRLDHNYTCEDVTMLNLGDIENSFKKLPLRKAVLKAIGELDILLNWMDKLH